MGLLIGVLVIQLIIGFGAAGIKSVVGNPKPIPNIEVSSEASKNDSVVEKKE